MDESQVETKAALSRAELEYIGATIADLKSVQLEVPDIAKERCDQGIVKYVAPGVKEIKVGDHVLFGGYTGSTVALEGEGVLIILRETFVTAVIHGPDTTVPGLFFMDADGPFPATYESAMQLLVRAMEDHPAYKSIKIKNQLDAREKSLNAG